MKKHFVGSYILLLMLINTVANANPYLQQSPPSPFEADVSQMTYQEKFRHADEMYWGIRDLYSEGDWPTTDSKKWDQIREEMDLVRQKHGTTSQEINFLIQIISTGTPKTMPFVREIVRSSKFDPNAEFDFYNYEFSDSGPRETIEPLCRIVKWVQKAEGFRSTFDYDPLSYATDAATLLFELGVNAQQISSCYHNVDDMRNFSDATNLAESNLVKSFNRLVQSKEKLLEKNSTSPDIEDSLDLFVNFYDKGTTVARTYYGGGETCFNLIKQPILLANQDAVKDPNLANLVSIYGEGKCYTRTEFSKIRNIPALLSGDPNSSTAVGIIGGGR